jgi:hypothetical protein
MLAGMERFFGKLSTIFVIEFLKWLPDSKENYDQNRICYMEHGEKQQKFMPH